MNRSLTLATALLVTAIGSASLAQAQEALIPGFVLKDNLGNVVGPAVIANSTVHVRIADTTNNDFFYLQFGKYWFRGSEIDEMYFDNDDCTGQAYVSAPEAADSSIPSLRGSSYAVGPLAAGNTTFGRIYRSTGAIGSDNSLEIESKWELSNSKMGAGEGPECKLVSIASSTVTASPVATLDAFVANTIANKPFSVE